MSSPILANPKKDKTMVLNSDGSGHAWSAVLSQVQESHERALAYYSKTMNKHEINYCTMRNELQAIVVAHFNHYIFSHKVIHRNDNSAASCVKKLKNSGFS